MSCSKPYYNAEKCDGDFCIGECDICPKKYEDVEDKDIKYYREMYNIVSDINTSMHKTIELYHEQFMKDQETIRGLKKKIEELTEGNA